LKEAAKLGFTQAAMPGRTGGAGVAGVTVRNFADLTAFVGDTFGAG
jgi:DNA repair protein RadA/Sms